MISQNLMSQSRKKIEIFLNQQNVYRLKQTLLIKTIQEDQILMKKVRIIIVVFALILCISNQLGLPNNEPKHLEYTPPRKDKNDFFYIGFVFGPMIIALGIVGIWFNEKRAAINYKRLKLAEKLVGEQFGQPIELPQIQTQNNLLQTTTRLVHNIAMTEILQAARDEQCQVFQQDAIAILREVEVKEIRRHIKRGSKQNQYRLEWVQSNLQYYGSIVNPTSRWFIRSGYFFAPRVAVAGFFLNEDQIRRLKCQTEVNPTPETINALRTLSQRVQSIGQPIVQNNYVYFPASNGNIESRGSLRVKFLYCQPTKLSIMSCANDATREYQPYRIDLVDNNGQEDEMPCQNSQSCLTCCCKMVIQHLQSLSVIDLILKGEYSYDEMVKVYVKKYRLLTDISRLIFYAILGFGVFMLLTPIAVLLGEVPLVGGFLKSTTIFFILLGAFIISIPLFFIIFGLAWLRYHPALGKGALLIAVGTLAILSSIK